MGLDKAQRMLRRRAHKWFEPSLEEQDRNSMRSHRDSELRVKRAKAGPVLVDVTDEVCYTAELMSLAAPCKSQRWIQTARCFSWTRYLRLQMLPTDTSRAWLQCLTHKHIRTHAELNLKTHNTFVTLKTIREDGGESDHYDNCYDNDNDEYRAVQTLGTGGRGESYCTWIILLRVIYTELKKKKNLQVTPPSLTFWLEVNTHTHAL